MREFIIIIIAVKELSKDKYAMTVRTKVNSASYLLGFGRTLCLNYVAFLTLTPSSKWRPKPPKLDSSTSRKKPCACSAPFVEGDARRRSQKNLEQQFSVTN